MMEIFGVRNDYGDIIPKIVHDVRNQGNKSIKVERTVYWFDNKTEAKKHRNELKEENKKDYFVTLGPDHWKRNLKH